MFNTTNTARTPESWEFNLPLIDRIRVKVIRPKKKKRGHDRPRFNIQSSPASSTIS
jgi:hypothetical protein